MKELEDNESAWLMDGDGCSRRSMKELEDNESAWLMDGCVQTRHI